MAYRPSDKSEQFKKPDEVKNLPTMSKMKRPKKAMAKGFMKGKRGA